MLSQIFWGKFPFGQKWQKILKNDPRIEFYLCFETFCHWFLLEMYLSKSWYCYLFYCTNLISEEILVLELEQERLSVRLQDSLITYTSWWNDWITLLFAFRQIVRRGKKIAAKFSIGCGAQRLLKSCSVTENIEWKIKWKQETFHAILILNLSQQILLSNQIAVLVDQLEIYKDHCFYFFLWMLGDNTQKSKMLKKYGILGPAGIGVKWKY